MHADVQPVHALCERVEARVLCNAQESTQTPNPRHHHPPVQRLEVQERPVHPVVLKYCLCRWSCQEEGCVGWVVCVCVCVYVRTERNGAAELQREMQRRRHTHRHTDTQTRRHANTEAHRNTHTPIQSALSSGVTGACFAFTSLPTGISPKRASHMLSISMRTRGSPFFTIST